MNAPAPLPPPGPDLAADIAALFWPRDPAPIPPPLFPPEALPRAEYLATLRAQAAPPVLPPPLPPPVPVWELPAGTQLRAALGTTTVLPDLDFEAYSEAGYVWDGGRMKWGCLRGTDKKGLGVVGAQVYAEHPSTEVLSLYYDLKDGRGRRRWLPSDPLPPVDLLEHVARGGTLEAWNSGFEYRIWNIVCRRRYGWPPLPLEQLRCAMAKSRAFSLPGKLEKAGQVLALSLQKDKDGERLLKKFSMPRDPTAKDARRRIHPLEDPVDGPKLYAYNERDIVAEAEASARVPDLNPDELAYWLMDQGINMRGVQMDVAGIENCIAIVEQAFAKYDGQLAVVTGGAVPAASEMPKLKAWLEAQGVRLPRTDKGGASLTDEVIDNLLAGDVIRPGALPPAAREALKLRQKVGSASIKKLFSMARMVSAAGRLHDLFNYYGARTGRATGQDSQPTNLPKAGPDVFRCFQLTAKAGGHTLRDLRGAGWTEAQLLEHGYATGCRKHYGAHAATCPWCGHASPDKSEAEEWSWRAAVDALEVIATRALAYVEHYFGDAIFTITGCLRGMFIAAPGHDLICSDYSAIEAVVLAMLAGVEWRVEVFRTHGKIYEASGAKVAGLTVEEVLAHKKKTGTHHPIRAKGKVMELACGYGGWIGAMVNFGADKYMTEEEMKTAVLEWRAASPEIPEFWGGQWRRVPGQGWRKELFGVEGAFVGAVLAPGTETEYRGLKFRMEGDAVFLRLLSGRYLTYHRPRLQLENKYGRDQFAISFEGWNTNPNNGPIGWIRIDTYGGRLTENIVQATARDIQWYGMRNLTAAGYPIVLHVYDEDVAEVPEGFGSVEEFERIMSTMPPWAADWPIRANGGWRGKRYRKD
jgi:DNA polymerase